MTLRFVVDIDHDLSLFLGSRLNLTGDVTRNPHFQWSRQQRGQNEGNRDHPRQLIGGVVLRVPVGSLPKGATVAVLIGKHMGINFTHKDGTIDDVWVDDLRKMRHLILWAGHKAPRHAKFELLM